MGRLFPLLLLLLVDQVFVSFSAAGPGDYLNCGRKGQFLKRHLDEDL